VSVASTWLEDTDRLGGGALGLYPDSAPRLVATASSPSPDATPIQEFDSETFLLQSRGNTKAGRAVESAICQQFCGYLQK
jgi:hypothetical protein